MFFLVIARSDAALAEIGSDHAVAELETGLHVGGALGAQAGEKRLTEVLNEGGFTRVRRATDTPTNMVLEARP